MLRSELPVGASVVPAQLLFNIKTNGDRKFRFVSRGDLKQKGAHYVASKSPMAAIEAVRMQAAPAAAAGWKLYTTDFSVTWETSASFRPKTASFVVRNLTWTGTVRENLSGEDISLHASKKNNNNNKK